MALNVTEIKAFVSARNYEISKRFYTDLGFCFVDPSGVVWRIGQNVG